jgi:hypothetical protein
MKKILALLILITLLLSGCDLLEMEFGDFIEEGSSGTLVETESTTMLPSDILDTPTAPNLTSTSTQVDGATSYSFDFGKEDFMPLLDDTLSQIDYGAISSTQQFVASGVFQDIGPYNCYCYTFGNNAFLYVDESPDTGKVLQIELSMVIADSSADTRNEFSCLLSFLAGFIEYEDAGNVLTLLNNGEITEARTSYTQGKYGNYWFTNDGIRADLIIRKVY